MSVRFSITISLVDFIAANRLYLRRYWILSGLLKVYGIGALLFFLMILALTAIDQPLTWQFVFTQMLVSLAFGLGMVVFMPIVTLVTMRLTVKRHFEQLSLGLPVVYEIDANGLRAANEIATSTLTWDRLCDFVQDRRMLLLRRTPRFFFVLPKAQLSGEQLETILALLREAGVKES